VTVDPAAGSLLAAGSFAYLMVELSGMAVASLRIEISLSRVDDEKLGLTMILETWTRTPPEPLCYMLVSRNSFHQREKTYKATGADLDLGCGLVDTAMSSSDDGVGVQQSTTADVGTTLLHGDDEGEVASGSSSTTNNLDREVLGKGGSENSGGSREGSEK
jgi:hypothetical protein